MLESDGRWPVTRTVAVVMETTMGSGDGWTRPMALSQRFDSSDTEQRRLERPLVTLIARMIRSKSSVPHPIIRAELAAAPLVTGGSVPGSNLHT